MEKKAEIHVKKLRDLHVKKFSAKLLMKLNIAKAKTRRTIRSIVSEAVQDWMKKK